MGSILIIFIALLILGGYYFFSSREEEKNITEEKVTVVQSLLLRNIETNYPPSPKEVVRYYCEISQCFYEEISEDELQKLANRSRELFDAELYKLRTDEDYLEDLKEEIAYFKEKGMTISSFALSPSIDVEYWVENESSFAKLYCIFSLREKTKIVTTEQLFLLREDSDGHWKILGFGLTENEE